MIMQSYFINRVYTFDYQSNIAKFFNTFGQFMPEIMYNNIYIQFNGLYVCLKICDYYCDNFISGYLTECKFLLDIDITRSYIMKGIEI